MTSICVLRSEISSAAAGAGDEVVCATTAVGLLPDSLASAGLKFTARVTTEPIATNARQKRYFCMRERMHRNVLNNEQPPKEGEGMGLSEAFSVREGTFR